MPENENASPMTAEEIFNKLPTLGRDGHYFHISQSSVIGAMEKYADQQMKSSLALYENQNQTIIKFAKQLEEAKRENEKLKNQVETMRGEADKLRDTLTKASNHISRVAYLYDTPAKQTDYILKPYVKALQNYASFTEALQKGGNDNG